MGELLSMGVPIITNTGVGDVDSIVKDTRCGVLINNFNNQDYKVAIEDLLKNFDNYTTNTTDTAHRYFSLNDGVEKYKKIYQSFN